MKSPREYWTKQGRAGDFAKMFRLYHRMMRLTYHKATSRQLNNIAELMAAACLQRNPDLRLTLVGPSAAEVRRMRARIASILANHDTQTE